MEPKTDGRTTRPRPTGTAGHNLFANEG